MSDDKQDSRSLFTKGHTDASDNESNGAAATPVEDRELRELLEHWRAPEVSPTHERRMLEAYRKQLNNQPQEVNSAAFPQHQNEVVKMKTCSTCQEEFADKFSFCPVDGTPLNGYVAHAVEPALSAVQTNASSVTLPASESFAASDATIETTAAALPVVSQGASREEFHLTMIEDTGLVNRLTTELREVAHASQLTWPEFKRDPVGFSRRSAAAYSLLIWRFFRSPNIAIASLAAIFIVLFVVIGIIAGDRYRSQHMAQNDVERVDQLLDFSQVQDIPEEQKPVEKGPAGMNKGKGGGSKPKQEKPSGGGGGGQEQPKPVSFGKPPQASLVVPPIVRPNVTPPAIKNPSLPTPATLDLDPKLARNDLPPMPYGDLKSKSTDPSAGTGTGGGLGNGKGLGAGSGEGGGLGPGRGGNTGGGDRGLGGGGAGGGGEGVDYNRIFKPNEVTQKYQILSKPEAQFTEEARKNQTTGTIRLRAVLSASGQVTGITPVNRLPYGLTENAIAAARQIRFVPAKKDGHPVSVYVTLEYNMNMY
jgi:TonB family protein